MNFGIRDRLIGAVAALGVMAGGSAAWAGAPVAIYTFQGGSDGSQPVGNLVADAAGNLYGATTDGGTSRNGVVFELTPPATQSGSWTETVLYRFTGGADGNAPVAGLVRDGAGNLYGTTSGGGCLPNCNGSGYGTVFKLTPASNSNPWTFTTIYRFQPRQGVQDGVGPEAPLTLDGSGNLYGTTYAGGLYAGGFGVVFKLTPPSGVGPWSETLLHVFNGYSDAAHPFAGVTFDGAGNLYGTTSEGGFVGKCCGVVFELTPTAGGSGPWTETILHRFMGPDGKRLVAGVDLDAFGNVFGVTELGAGSNNFACNAGCGAAFEINASSGSGPPEQTIYRFLGGASGSEPIAVLYQNGNLYGVALANGSQNNGALFVLSPSGKKFWNNVPTSFPSTAGAGPESLTIDPPLSGTTTFYGVAFRGGGGRQRHGL